MIISDTHRYAFVSTPKTGTHSLFHMLQSDWQGAQAEGPYHLRIVPPEAQGYFVFTTVRHPFARTVSIWHALTRVDPYPDIYLPLVGAEDFASFSDWLIDFDPETLKTGRGKVLLTRQSDWLADLALDRALHIERVDAEFKSLPFVSPDTKAEVPKLLARKHESWTDLVKGAPGQRLADWLAPDFEQFGYAQDQVDPVI